MKLLFTISSDITNKELLAEKELRRYLNMLSVDDDNKRVFHIHFNMDTTLGKSGSFSICSLLSASGEIIITITGQDDNGLLYAIYELLESIGFGFYPDRDTVPSAPNIGILGQLDIKSEPSIPLRGMFVIPWFDDLPCYASYWNYDRWEIFVDWIAKQKMNLLRLHIFPSMGFYPMEKYIHTRPGENNTGQKRMIMEKIITRAHERGIAIALSFYPNAVTREFSGFYPGTAYNAWYTFFVCLDTELGQDYSFITVKEMIETYHPDYIELVTTEVHCPFCGWEKFSKDQLQLFGNLIKYIKSTGTKISVFPFVFPLGYEKLMEALDAPADTLLFTEAATLSNTGRYLAGGHYIACFEENSCPFMRFKLQEPGQYASNYSRQGTALTYYLTGFTTKNFEISAVAAAKQFWNPAGFQIKPYLTRAVSDRFPLLVEKEQGELAESLTRLENAWDILENIVLDNGERMFGLMPSVANSNYSMFFETYAAMFVRKKKNIEKAIMEASKALNYIQNIKASASSINNAEINQIELNQKIFYFNYKFLIEGAEAFCLHRKSQYCYKRDLWGMHTQAEELSSKAHALMEGTIKNLRDLVEAVRKDSDYHDVKNHVHPYQAKDASVYHNHSGFTLEVLEHRLYSAGALLDEMRALKDKLILERTFQGPHRPFVIPNKFQL